MTTGRGVIWDLDGTLYRYSAQSSEIFAQATVHAALQCGVRESVEHLLAQARPVRSTHTLVARWERDYGVDPALFHDVFYAHPDVARVVDPIPGVADCLERWQEVDHLILTHASRDWVRRILVLLGISHLFPENRVLALEDVGFCYKHDSDAPVRQAADRLGLASHQITMVEDTAANLPYAYALGIETVLIHHGQPRFPLPSHIHRQYESPVDFLELVEAESWAPAQ